MSGSKSSSATSTENRDGRVAGDNGAIGVSADGPVAITVTSDEAFELGEEALAASRAVSQSAIDAATENADTVADTLSEALFRTQDYAAQTTDNVLDKVAGTLSDALYSTQQSAKSEAGQIGEQMVKIAIPAAVIGVIALATIRK